MQLNNLHGKEHNVRAVIMDPYICLLSTEREPFIKSVVKIMLLFMDAPFVLIAVFLYRPKAGMPE